MKQDFSIGQTYLQNCGDYLQVLEKSSNKKGNVVLYRCIFKNYLYEIDADKRAILNGSVLNPRIEEVEFIGKEFPQNCGDTLKVINKTEQKNNQNHYLYKCEFIKYPYKILIDKKRILNGSVLNPQIEQFEFIGKKFKQKCGNYLLVLEKTDIKDKDSYLYKCIFTNDNYEILAKKEYIKKGLLFNDNYLKSIYLNKKYQQQGDILRITKIIDFYNFEGEFINYPCKIKGLFTSLEKGIINPNLPWISKINLENYIKENFKDKKPSLQDISIKLNISLTTIARKINEYNLNNYIHYYYTERENDLNNFINQYTICNHNNWFKELNYEIDSYIPSQKLGIEFNGNYWHSELFKKQNYHQEKSLKFKEKNINLIHIFEYEWNDVLINTKIKSLIKSKLGLFEKKIYARKCEIKEISNLEYQNFCNENHIQGYCAAKIKIGLFYQKELIQIISFSIPRFTDKYEYECIRECSKLNYCIVGGKSKLFKYFLTKYNPKSILSYCDFSKFNGNSYLKLGFKFERLNNPGFVWWDKNKDVVYWRNPYKHKEMKDAGYLKIYDCGQLVFTWNQ